MQRAVFHGNGAIEIASACIPEPGAGEIRVKVAACCLCGSDFRPWRQGWPVTPGHEIAGIVDQPGHPRHGERVAIYIPVFCDRCEECAGGHTHTCLAMTDLVGWQRDGGYAGFVKVPERCLLTLPEDIPLRHAPLLLDTIGTAAHGYRLAAPIVKGGPVLILGAGPLGLGALVLAKQFGFGPVDIVEPQANRRGFAAELGGAPMLPGEVTRRYPLVIECSGKSAARQTALEHVAPRGGVIQLGEADRWEVEETRSIRRKDFHYVRSFYFAKGEFTANCALFRADRDAYARFVDAEAGLQGLSSLFNEFATGRLIKPALVMPH